MSVCAGHGHEIEGVEENKGGFCLLHTQYHLEEGISELALGIKLLPLVAAFLV